MKKPSDAEPEMRKGDNFDRFDPAEKNRLPTSPYSFDETMARVLRVKPEPKEKKRKP